ncbi:hypothetical protein B9Z55_002625 [Caenorhabditis nigoni]|uniref:BED-type domain-containing protein n=1 Tax=Caenorhabditis nigoni TaxID=1611254 RepID=A0A2G5VLP3_9PELO|nr:hypothetical protein B9Z55_002625 [Caenorhabditis nigoni]
MSKVINFFNIQNEYFVCKICTKKLRKPKDTSHSGITYHLKSTHPNEYEEIQKRKTLMKKEKGQQSIQSTFQPFLEDSAEAIFRSISQWMGVDTGPCLAIEQGIL